MKTPRALIVGMGIGGLAAAMRLREIGWEPMLVERAAQRRPAGYFIGLFETGRATAQRMGVLDAISNRAGADSITYNIERSGRRRPGMGYGDLPGEPRLILRGDIEAALLRNGAAVARALREWDQRLRPFITRQQRSGRTQGLTMFVPQSRRDKALWTFTQRLMSRPAGKRVMKSLAAPQFAEKSIDIAAV